MDMLRVWPIMCELGVGATAHLADGQKVVVEKII